MAFKIKARSILHLGAELISSDSIALFELVKNAFDARSKNGVSISVKITLPSWPGRFPVLLKTVQDAEALLACCVVADKAAAKENLAPGPAFPGSPQTTANFTPTSPPR